MPEVAMALLGKQVSDIEIVAAVPNNKAGVAKAYRPQTAEITAVVREYESIANQLSAIPNSSVLTQSSSGGATIRETLLKRAGANQKKQLLVVVGHNVDGILRFPDGSSLKVADLADTASKSGRPVLVLSCETMYANIATAGFVTARPLHFDEISRALIKLSTAHRLGQINNVREVIQQINFILGAPPRASKAEKRTETLVAVAQIGSALLAATIVSTAIGIQQSCKEDRKDKC
jgi:hypothetical protein